MSGIIEIEELSKTFHVKNSREVEALKEIDLSIKEHEFVCILGASGSGKSTLLRLMEGLIKPTRGSIKVFGEELTEPISKTGMVFQQYTLLPWRNIIDNVTFGLEIRGVSKKERYKIANDILLKFGLKGFNNSYPHELSGGMQQRVAIARTIATSPKIIYMDEPFGALDAITRKEMQKELMDFWLQDKRTIVFVTHSVEEAVLLGNRVIVMSSRPGRVIGDIDINLPYPRDKWNEKFGSYVKKLINIMNDDDINDKIIENVS